MSVETVLQRVDVLFYLRTMNQQSLMFPGQVIFPFHETWNQWIRILSEKFFSCRIVKKLYFWKLPQRQ